MSWCDHYACRCARANELALIAEHTGDPRYLADALAVHDQLVQCRMPTADREKENSDASRATE